MWVWQLTLLGARGEVWVDFVSVGGAAHGGGRRQDAECSVAVRASARLLQVALPVPGGALESDRMSL